MQSYGSCKKGRVWETIYFQRENGTKLLLQKVHLKMYIEKFSMYIFKWTIHKNYTDNVKILLSICMVKN